MKEVLRLTEVSTERGSSPSPLRGYNLEIFAGDVMSVSGTAGSGVLGLLSLLSGKSGISGGKIEIREQPAAGRRDHSALWQSVYLCGDAGSQFVNLTVAENLALLSRRHTPGRLYRQKETAERAARYLQEAGLPIDPQIRISRLSPQERNLLALVMARMAHASLAVIDCTRALLSDVATEPMRSMITRFSGEGMAFLLISFREDVMLGTVTRHQRMEYGRDRAEWSAAMMRQARFESPVPGRRALGNMTGFVDEWIHYTDGRTYLNAVKRFCPDIWKAEAGFPVPGEDFYARKGTVLIPRDSAVRLPENLFVADNLILPIPGKVGRGPFRRIPEATVRAAESDFRQVMGIDAAGKRVRQLSIVERKLLSIYRWELARPKALVLQEPFFGLDPEECRRLDAYLERLRDRGIRVYMLSSSRENAESLCRRIIVTEQGRDARVYEVGRDPSHGG